MKRCEVDLAATGLFAQEGTGAFARSDRVGRRPHRRPDRRRAQRATCCCRTTRSGWSSSSRAGRSARCSTAAPSSTPTCSGPRAPPGKDQFGRMGLVYALGRVSKVTDVEILADGSAGGPAIVASTGDDAPHDLFNLSRWSQTQARPERDFVVDPDAAAADCGSPPTTCSLRARSRVRMLTAFCNDGETRATSRSSSCSTSAARSRSSTPAAAPRAGQPPSAWWTAPAGWARRATDVAYGIRSYVARRPRPPRHRPTRRVIYGGVVGSIVEARDMAGAAHLDRPRGAAAARHLRVRPGASAATCATSSSARDLAGRERGAAGASTAAPPAGSTVTVEEPRRLAGAGRPGGGGGLCRRPARGPSSRPTTTGKARRGAAARHLLAQRRAARGRCPAAAVHGHRRGRRDARRPI